MRCIFLCPMSIGLVMLLSACSAGGPGWPKLAGDPPAQEIELLPPVKTPEPALLSAPMSADEAERWFEALAGQIESLARQAEDQSAAFKQVHGEIAQDGNENLEGLAFRTAQFHLSRLSRIETAASKLMRNADAAIRGTPTALSPKAREDLEELRLLHRRLSKMLDDAREQMAVYDQ